MTAKGGRPTKFDKAYIEQARKLCSHGLTDQEIADFFGVHVATIHRWKHDHPKFCDALKAGKEAADERVKRSLYHRAVGYEYDTVKIMQYEGAPVIVPYREHVPPSDTAAIFWLKNRDPENWRDRVTHANDPQNPMPDSSGALEKLSTALARIADRGSAG